jgi:hypothetical protein
MEIFNMDKTMIKRFEVFTVVKIEFVVFWVVALCSVPVGYRHFGGHWY